SQADVACGPVQTGAPCPATGPATLPLIEGPGLGAGNPVNVATGNKYQREVDIPPWPGMLGVELIRHYNSADRRVGAFGTGWVSSYDTRLYRMGGHVQIVQADGSRVEFVLAQGAATCAAQNPSYGTLTVTDSV